MVYPLSSFERVKPFLKTVKMRVGNDQEIAQSERNSDSKNRRGGKTKLTIKYIYEENITNIGPENAHMKPYIGALRHHEMTLTLNTHTLLLKPSDF